jgi:serine/threonine protein kinase
MSPTTSRAAQRVGVVLKGKWRLDALIGVGGMAAVYSATHRNGSRVAIKMLNAEYSAQSDCVARFMREGYVANKINHPGSVLVLDDDLDDDGSAFLVMELLSGYSLERYARRGSTHLSLEHILHIGERVLDLLAVAHSLGILHRDIKPANIQLTAEGAVKVLDFGIARLGERVGDASATQTGASLGTPSYMPPEQARGRWNMVDPRTDLWALGATMHALILGERPRRAETVQEEMLLAMTAPMPSLGATAPQTPPSVVAMVDKATAFEMDARWRNALEMQQAVRNLLTGGSAGASAPLIELGATIAAGVANVGAGEPGSASGPRLDTARMVPAKKTADGDSSTLHATEHTAPPPAAKPKPLLGVMAVVFLLAVVVGTGLAARVFLASRGTANASAATPGPAAAPSPTPAPTAAAAPSPDVASPAAPPPDPSPPSSPPVEIDAPAPVGTPAASAPPAKSTAPVHHHSRPAGNAAPAGSASIYDERF